MNPTFRTAVDQFYSNGTLIYGAQDQYRALPKGMFVLSPFLERVDMLEEMVRRNPALLHHVDRDLFDLWEISGEFGLVDYKCGRNGVEWFRIKGRQYEDGGCKNKDERRFYAGVVNHTNYFFIDLGVERMPDEIAGFYKQKMSVSSIQERMRA